MKNNENNLEEDFDNIFKNELSDLRFKPKAMNWEKISSHLEEDEVDVFAKNKLESLEVIPEPKIWKNVEKNLPLSLYIRNKLDWLSAVAAALTIFMLVMVIVDNQSSNSQTVADVEPITTPTSQEEIVTVEQEVDFVYNIDESASNDKKSSASNSLSEEDEKIISSFWDDFLDEDEDLVSEVDDELMEKSLEPILQLPIENLEAAIPIPSRPYKQIILSNKSDKNILETILNEKITLD